MTGAQKHAASPVAPAARRWSFASVTLDERSLELLVDGQPVEIEPKPLEVLLHLLRHAGEVVSKDELIEAVWPGRVLSDAAITTCIRKLREALRDTDQSLIKTVHGYGYRLIASVKVEASAAAPPPRFDFQPGASPPLRPNWRLVRRLGAGGHGEAWLAQHEKTREPRVFKFAAGGAALTSLKREVTLYRLLHDALGEAAPAIEVLDWNLTDAPCFLELRYAEAGSLADWAAQPVGLSATPLAVRIDLIAQVAEALAAAHSMGVLHKDLKPANVLIVSRQDEALRIKLSDFGSGGLLDPARLEALGITRLGFTQTLLQTTGGTPIYCAPEVLAGQPPTIQADIYSLGVMLYQLVVGDLARALAPGWERDVPDELLREDIALAAEGHPSHRLADAAAFAQRLRSLDQRRAQRAAEQTAREEALLAQRRAERTTQIAQLALERMRARRNWMRATMAALAVGASATLALFVDARRARDEALSAAAATRAVSDFLSKDMFSAISRGDRPVRDVTVKQVLDAAAGKVEQRFADRPEVAAGVHRALGESYLTLESGREALTHLSSALRIYRQPESDFAAAIEVAQRIVVPAAARGELRALMPDLEALLRQGTMQLGDTEPRILYLRRSLAWGYGWLGSWTKAAAQLRGLLDHAQRSAPADEPMIAYLQASLGQHLIHLGEFAEAETTLRKCLADSLPRWGEKDLRIAGLRMSLGQLYIEQARYPEAREELTASLNAARQWLKDSSSSLYTVRLQLARLATLQNQAAAATGELEDILRRLLAEQTASGDLDQTAPVRLALAEAYQRQGRGHDAVAEMRRALASAESGFGSAHPQSAEIRVALADSLREQGGFIEARTTLDGLNHEALAELPEHHPLVGHLRMVEGLLWKQEGRADAARGALRRALAVYERRYGVAHWRTRRVRDALARLTG